MKPATPLYLTTHQVATLAGVRDHVVHISVQRHGHYLGVVPTRKPGTTAWTWPASNIYSVLGKFRPGTKPEAQALQDRLIDDTGADPLAAHQIADWLLATGRPAMKPADRIAVMHADQEMLADLLDAGLERFGQGLADEPSMAPVDWRRAQATTERMARAVARIVEFSLWVRVDKADKEGGAA